MSDTEQRTELEEALDTEPVTEQDEAVEAKPDEDDGSGYLSDKDADPDYSHRRKRPLTEKEFIREQMHLARLEWFNEHKTLVFVGIGVVLAILIFFGIRAFNNNNNPVTWLVQSCVKDFGTSFDYTVTMSEDGEPVMKYEGSIECDRSAQTIEALYEADYGSYAYTGALTADKDKAVKGRLYKKKWTAEDCTEQVRDFFALDRSLKNGDLDAGALLRFLGLTSDYTSTEIDRFSKRLKGLLSSDSAVSTVKAASVEGGTRYVFDISLGELFGMIAEDGAPLFFRSTDYNSFKESYELNKSSLKRKVCRMSYVIDTEGYLAVFEIELEAEGTVYKLECRMSDFGKAEVELPEDFLKAAELIEEE